MKRKQNHTDYMANCYDYYCGNYNEDLNFLVSEARKTKSIIEFGIGTGRVAIPIAKLGKTVVGVDPSSSMLKICADKAKNENVEITLHKGKMHNFSAKKKFDLLICTFRVFLHNKSTNDQIETLKNFKKHLNKNGKAIISFFSFDYEVYKKYAQNNVTVPFIGPDGTKHRKVYVTKHDFADQIISTNVKIYKSNKLIDTHELDLSWIYKKEFELLIKAGGLKVHKLYGGFNKKKYTGKEEMVWVLSR